MEARMTRFYAARISLLPVRGNLFYVTGSEHRTNLIEESLSHPFEFKPSRGGKILHDPLISKAHGFVGGVIGREGEALLPRRVEGRFVRQRSTVHPHIYYFFLADEQVLVFEQNTSVFRSRNIPLRAISKYLSDRLRGKGLSVHLNLLTLRGDFWTVLEELDAVHRIELRFVVPNFLGQLHEKLAFALKAEAEVTGADEIEQRLYSSAGELEYPRGGQYEEALGWIEDGGGQWKAFGTKNGRPTSHNSQERVVTFDKRVTIRGYTAEEIGEIAREFDLGEYSVIRRLEQRDGEPDES